MKQDLPKIDKCRQMPGVSVRVTVIRDTDKILSISDPNELTIIDEIDYILLDRGINFICHTSKQ